MKETTRSSLCGTLLAAGLFLFSGTVSAGQDDQAKLSGFVGSTYDYRGLGADHDQDVYAYWHLRAADPQLEIYTSGRLHKDIDGTSKSFNTDPFIGLDDTSRNDQSRLLQCYAEMYNKDRTASVRVGRQYVEVADYIQMDGLQAMLFENQTIGGRVFGGKPVSYYSSTTDDTFAGVSLTGRPWQGNRSRATYARYDQDSIDKTDDYFNFDMRQQFTDELRTRGYASLMNGDMQMGGLDLFYMSMEEKVFDVVMGVRHWGSYTAETRAYSPLVQSLGELEPYTTAYGRMTTQILPWFYLSPGASIRRSDDDNATNRDYENYDISFIFEPTAAFSSSIALQYWNVKDSDSFFGLSGDIRYRYEKLWELGIGAAYVDYRYYGFSDFSVATQDDPTGGVIIADLDGTRVKRSPNAYTYYMSGKWNITERYALRVSGEVEDDSEEQSLGYSLRTSFEVRL